MKVADGNTATQALTVTVTDVVETATLTISGLADGTVAENADGNGAVTTSRSTGPPAYWAWWDATSRARRMRMRTTTMR